MSSDLIARIPEFEELGFRRWTKGAHDRMYIKARDLGLTIEYRKTGSICNAYFGDGRLSNSEGYRMRDASTYIDLHDGMVHGTNRTLMAEAARITGLPVCDD